MPIYKTIKKKKNSGLATLGDLPTLNAHYHSWDDPQNTKTRLIREVYVGIVVSFVLVF